MSQPPANTTLQLKADSFGTIEVTYDPEEVGPGEFNQGNSCKEICRNTDKASWWAGAIARHLAGREARALIALNELPGIPQLRNWNGHQLRREWLAGFPMQEAKQPDKAYFKAALRLLRQMHRHTPWL